LCRSVKSEDSSDCRLQRSTRRASANGNRSRTTEVNHLCEKFSHVGWKYPPTPCRNTFVGNWSSPTMKAIPDPSLKKNSRNSASRRRSEIESFLKTARKGRHGIRNFAMLLLA